MNIDIIRRCIVLRSGMEVWVAKDRAEKLGAALEKGSAPKFFEVDGTLINTFEITGIFTADAMEDLHRRKNGQWKCMKGKWHEKGQGCYCRTVSGTRKAHVEGVGEIEYNTYKD